MRSRRARRGVTTRAPLREPGSRSSDAATFAWPASSSWRPSPSRAFCNTWCASYLVSARGMAAGAAAGMVTVYYVGVTAGRFLSGAPAPTGSPASSSWGWGRRSPSWPCSCFSPRCRWPPPRRWASSSWALATARSTPNMLHLTPRLFGPSIPRRRRSACRWRPPTRAPSRRRRSFALLAERVGFWLFPVALLVLSVVVVAAFLGHGAGRGGGRAGRATGARSCGRLAGGLALRQVKTVWWLFSKPLDRLALVQRIKTMRELAVISCAEPR